MLIFLACWLLLIAPMMLFAAMMLGANLYAKGQHGQIPTLQLPRFSTSKRNGQAVQPSGRTLPEV